jgi:chemotaxis protein CheD
MMMAQPLGGGMQLLDETSQKNLAKAVEIAVGQFDVSNKRTNLFKINTVTSGLVLILYDNVAGIGGVAYMMLPDSDYIEGELAVEDAAQADDHGKPAKFANKAVALVWEKMEGLGAKPANTVARLIGGSQLFTFGGGGGNPLNLGSRNAIACRTLLSRLGIIVDKTEVGGNRPRNIVFSLIKGDCVISIRGGREFLL